MTFKKAVPIFLALVLAGAVFSSIRSVSAQSSTTDRWIHVRVLETNDKGETNESVKVNVPLSLAEAVLPAVKAHRLENGKVHINEHDFHHGDVDIRALFEAVKNTKDGEFVTIEKKRGEGRTESVRVAKQNGYMLVKVEEGTDKRVDVKVPISVVEAMLGGGKDELDLLAGIRALAKHGDQELVSVKEKRQSVRIWIDSKNTAE
ncbi:MAG: hypothetical protein HY046_11455 [Acidobacteria bacterium]|nr:hypothetical protein [Acidobacteriota bacterium]